VKVACHVQEVRPFLRKPYIKPPLPRKRMTVCIAASCENGKKVAVATDTRLSFAGIASDSLAAKFVWMGDWLIMFAGDPGRFELFLEELRKFPSLERTSLHETINSAYRQMVSKVCAHGALARYNLTMDDFKKLGLETFRRVEIPKPDGGVRKLGVPTVLDRMIQQAVMQVLQGSWDNTFSESSYGFRPGRSAHQAVARAQQHIAAGYRWVVDLDLEKFFDRVNHDRLMEQIAKRVHDKRLLRLIRSWLKAGVLENGLVGPTDEGTPQGGPLSPLLSNLVLDQLDRELERRGHRFARYADDCNIYVRSRRAGQRLMGGLTRLLEGKLKLKVNREKSAVARPWERKFLGFSFTNGRQPKRRIAPKAKSRFEARVRILTRRTRGISIETMVRELGRYLQGWQGYFGFCQTPTVLDRFNKWIRRRIRSAACKQWRTGKTRYARLRELGLSHDLAARTAGHQWGPWRLSRTEALSYAMPAAYFDRLGLPALRCTPGV
jgi:RNA-directed DNA polymerase